MEARKSRGGGVQAWRGAAFRAAGFQALEGRGVDVVAAMGKLTKSMRRKDGGVARSGLLKRPSVASHAPAGWRMPREHRDAAKRFDERHQLLSARCEKLLPKTRHEHLRARGGKGPRSDGLTDFERALAEVRVRLTLPLTLIPTLTLTLNPNPNPYQIRWNRYFVPEVHVAIGAVPAKERKPL